MALPTEFPALIKTKPRRRRVIRRAPRNFKPFPQAAVHNQATKIITAAKRKTSPVQRTKKKSRTSSIVFNNAYLRGQFYSDARGLYRVHNNIGYRFYRSNTGPPVDGDTPYSIDNGLPATPTDTFADGTWWISVSWFNGLFDTGFFRIGPNGESFIRIDIDVGAEVPSPPLPVNDSSLRQDVGGLTRIQALYAEFGSNRATQFAIKTTIDGTDPPIMSDLVGPDVVVTIGPNGLAVLDYAFPGLTHGVVLKVRIQTRRTSPANIYSESSPILMIIGDLVGPGAPTSVEHWPGRLPGTL